MYIKKLDLLFYLVNYFSDHSFVDTVFSLDDRGNNCLLSKMQFNGKIVATMKVFYNYEVGILDTEINFL